MRPPPPVRPPIAPQFALPLTGRQYLTDETKAKEEALAEDEHNRQLETNQDYFNAYHGFDPVDRGD